MATLLVSLTATFVFSLNFSISVSQVPDVPVGVPELGWPAGGGLWLRLLLRPAVQG